MPYHPSRPVTSPFRYMETSLSLGMKKSGQLEQAPSLPGRLNGAQRRAKSEVFDLLTESGMDKAVLDESSVLDDTLSFCLKKLQLLDQVCIVLVKLSISVDISEESPVIEVIDGVLKNGIGGSITPEATTEPGGEGFQWFVRGVIGSGV